MRTLKLGILLCSGLLVWAGADSAMARAHRGGKPMRAARPAPLAVPQTVGYVPAPRRTTPPAFALRPELSEGEWATAATKEQLSPNDLASAAATVTPAPGAARAASVRATVGKFRERNLQDSPALMTSSLDRPLTEVSPDKIEIPAGFEFLKFGFSVNQSGQN